MIKLRTETVKFSINTLDTFTKYRKQTNKQKNGTNKLISQTVHIYSRKMKLINNKNFD